MNDEKTIRLDRMRYTKNSAASGLALAAILFDVFYFISIYESNVGSWYYNILMGASILYNLVFMLAAFLSSEGIKNYKIGYGYAMIVPPSPFLSRPLPLCRTVSSCSAWCGSWPPPPA